MRKILFFDLDGTLVDSRKDIANSVNATLLHFNLPPLSETEIAANTGNGPGWLIEQSLGKNAVKYVAEAKRFFAETYFEKMVENTLFFEGIPEVLKYFDKDLKIVLTNKSQKYAEKILNHLNLNGYFELVAGFEYFPEAKPSPKPILNLLERFDFSASQACMVGDSEMDVKAGQGANIKTCAVTWGNRSSEFLEKLSPDFIAYSPRELITLLDW